WSCARLAPHERRVLAGLATLPDTFTIDAACAVAAPCGLDGEAMLDVLATLVAKSLVEVDATPPAPVRRYRLSDTLRAFAREMPVAAAKPADADADADNTGHHAAHAIAPPVPDSGAAASPQRPASHPPSPALRREAESMPAAPPLHPPPPRPANASSGYLWHAVSPLDTSRSVVPVLAVPTARGAPVPRRGRARAGTPARACQASMDNARENPATSRTLPRSVHVSQGKRRARREPS
ncbi:hypothetical protein G3N92_23235, partial [Burkholderia sp. Ac-20379]|nr:hypothetical protein [Burkholderia sp. Ac-20379]